MVFWDAKASRPRIRMTAGWVYYTADGTDPRAAGGAVAASASIGEDKERLRAERDARIKTRVLKDGVWSALATATTPLPAL